MFCQQAIYIMYTIDIAKDYGPSEQLLTIEVWGSGEGPSAEGAEPLDEEEWNDDDNDAMDASTEASANVATIKQDENKELDHYTAYMDPETLTYMLMWSQLEMD